MVDLKELTVPLAGAIGTYPQADPPGLSVRLRSREDCGQTSSSVSSAHVHEVPLEAVTSAELVEVCRTE